MSLAPLSSKRDTYFSQRLSNRLMACVDAPVTVVEAPAGYGKTTALRYLEEICGDKARVFWFTGIQEDKKYAWERFCQTISCFDPVTGEALLQNGRPNRVNGHQIAQLILKLTCQEETILILDNYQVWQNELDTPIVMAMLNPACKKLHIVISTQYFRLPSGPDSSLYSLNRITTEDLTLTAQDIREFFRQSCREMTLNEAAALYRSTEGWPVAVSLCLRGCNQCGVPRADYHVDSLLDEVYFDRLTQAEQEMLLPFALFDAVTERQLSQLFMGTPSMVIRELVRRTPMIRYDASAGVYYPHALIQDFLRLRLSGAPEELRTRIYRKAGERHQERGDLVRAIHCFYNIRDYESILALPLINLCFAKIENIPFEAVAREILDNCPFEVFKKHPISLLRLAYYLFAATDFNGFKNAMDLAKDIVEESQDPALKGEWLVMDAFSFYPDAGAMGSRWKEAYDLLQRHCRVIAAQEPLFFGCQSMWYMFRVKPGKADEIGRELSKAVYWYNKLTGGHAGGADTLYLAELASIRGEYDEAQTLAYQSAHQSEIVSQPTVTYGVALLLGRIAISRQDMPGLEEAVNYLENKAAAYPFMQGSAMNDYMLDVCRTLLRSMMLELNQVPAWTLKGLQREETLGMATLMTGHAQIASIMIRGEYKKALGMMEAMLTQDKRICNLVMEYYIQVGIALCNLALLRRGKAIQSLDRAMELAHEDSMISIFVHYRDLLRILMISTELQKKYGPFIAKIMSVKRGFSGATFSEIENVISQDNLPETLTEREREIAILAAQGLRNREIAERVFISEQTVKNHLKTIFDKLAIDRRAKL